MTRGDPAGPAAPAIKAAVRGAFADDEPDWIEALWHRFHQVLGIAFSRLAE